MTFKPFFRPRCYCYRRYNRYKRAFCSSRSTCSSSNDRANEIERRWLGAPAAGLANCFLSAKSADRKHLR